jgi:hypothetical protein
MTPRHLGVLLGASKASSEHMVRSTQTMHYLASRFALSCVKISTSPKRTELSLEPRHLEVPSGTKLCTYPALTLTLSPNRKK